MEWSKDIDDPKDEHRHVNHLFGLHPGHTKYIDLNGQDLIKDMAKKMTNKEKLELVSELFMFLFLRTR